MRNEYDDLKTTIGKTVDEAFKLFDDPEEMKRYITSTIMVEVYNNFHSISDAMKFIDSMIGGRSEKDI